MICPWTGNEVSPISIHASLFKSEKTEWETPRDFFDRIDREFHFTLDVCANRANRKCAAYFTPDHDGLRQRWIGTCWMNPPYGHAIGRWLQKAHEANARGATVVCLVPARTDTAWWQDDAMLAHEIRLLRGRLRFVGAVSPAPFPSAVVIFNGKRRSGGVRVVAWDWRKGAVVADRGA